jgi:hypothetical protein
VTVEEVIRTRGIRELLHFTTNKGATGILGDGEVLPRSQLPTEKHLVNVYPPNSRTRYDTAHLGFVNLSVSRINRRFFDAASNWHRNEDVWWCALAFDPVVATHPGVQFATTNNMYTGCQRLEGGDGLEALFAERIHQYEERYVRRQSGQLSNWPTDRQAEVLYPGPLSTEFLRTIYVVTDAHQDVIEVGAEVQGHAQVPVVVRPGVFA